MTPPPPFLDQCARFQVLLAGLRCSGPGDAPLATEPALDQAVALLLAVREAQRTLFLIGNGGSAAAVAHGAVDFLNKGRLRALTLDTPPLLTCMANDFGYEQGFARPLETLARPGDLLVAMSSSGRSPNILNGVAAMQRVGGGVLTLSGFDADNPLRRLGDINFWLDHTEYGLVEVGHQFILHHLSDRVACA